MPSPSHRSRQVSTKHTLQFSQPGLTVHQALQLSLDALECASSSKRLQDPMSVDEAVSLCASTWGHFCLCNQWVAEVLKAGGLVFL